MNNHSIHHRRLKHAGCRNSLTGWKAIGFLLLVMGWISGLAKPGDCADSAGASGRSSTRAEQVAAYFGEPLNEVVALRTQGFGYAEITKIMVIARMSKQSLSALVARHKEGYGWGTISRELGLHAVEVKRAVDQVRRDLGISTRPQESPPVR